MRLDAGRARSDVDAPLRVAGRHEARVGDQQRAPAAQLAGQLAQRVDRAGAEDDARAAAGSRRGSCECGVAAVRSAESDGDVHGDA